MKNLIAKVSKVENLNESSRESSPPFTCSMAPFVFGRQNEDSSSEAYKGEFKFEASSGDNGEFRFKASRSSAEAETAVKLNFDFDSSKKIASVPKTKFKFDDTSPTKQQSFDINSSSPACVSKGVHLNNVDRPFLFSSSISKIEVCANCGLEGAEGEFECCTDCDLVLYCGWQCRRAHLKKHGVVCKMRSEELKFEEVKTSKDLSWLLGNDDREGKCLDDVNSKRREKTLRWIEMTQTIEVIDEWQILKWIKDDDENETRDEGNASLETQPISSDV